jgi:hypothetical protein
LAINRLTLQCIVALTGIRVVFGCFPNKCVLRQACEKNFIAIAHAGISISSLPLFAFDSLVFLSSLQESKFINSAFGFQIYFNGVIDCQEFAIRLLLTTAAIAVADVVVAILISLLCQ